MGLKAGIWALRLGSESEGGRKEEEKEEEEKISHMSESIGSKLKLKRPRSSKHIAV